jgi:hypothetical protein
VIQGSHVQAAPNQPLHGLERTHACQHEVRLDVVRAQSLQVLDVEGRRRVSNHLAIRLKHLRLRDRRSGKVVLTHKLGGIYLNRVDRDRDLVGLGIEFCQHVASVIAQPRGLVPTLRRRKRDGPANLNQQLGHGFGDAPDLVAEFLQISRAMPGLWVAHNGDGSA